MMIIQFCAAIRKIYLSYAEMLVGLDFQPENLVIKYKHNPRMSAAVGIKVKLREVLRKNVLKPTYQELLTKAHAELKETEFAWFVKALNILRTISREEGLL